MRHNGTACNVGERAAELRRIWNVVLLGITTSDVSLPTKTIYSRRQQLQ